MSGWGHAAHTPTQGMVEERYVQGGSIPPIPPGWVRCIYSLSPSNLLHAPGYMLLTAAALGVITAPAGGEVRDRGALEGRNPWVGEPLAPQVHKGVTVGMLFSPGCSALCGEKDTTIGCHKGLSYCITVCYTQVRRVVHILDVPGINGARRCCPFVRRQLINFVQRRGTSRRRDVSFCHRLLG